jgi:hypothetical protein
MKTAKAAVITLLLFSAMMTSGQRYDAFLDQYHFNKNFESIPGKKTNEYPGVQGSPYLNSEFTQGYVLLKDSSAAIMPLRYNIYANDMEYLVGDQYFAIGNPLSLKMVILEGAPFVYLMYDNGRGYFEVLASGKSSLLLKRSVEFKPEEGPKPIEGTITPARFVRNQDSYYIVKGISEPVHVSNMKSLIHALGDKKQELEKYTDTEKLKRGSKENMIKVVEYYNSL